MRLQPLLQDFKDTVIGKGRYEVQLEIPRTSTLTSREIEKVLAISTWKVNPEQEAVNYEGLRSILINRESPIKKGHVELKGLQISGIGYRKGDLSKVLQDETDKSFYPPSKENFMNRVKGTKMSTTHAEGKRIVDVKPKYRALGTYTTPELEQKVRNTMEVSSLQLGKMVLPHVEAYGRYLDCELTGKNGNFGFVVFPVPDAKKQRASTEFFENFNKIIKERNPSPREAVMVYYFTMAPYVGSLVEGLRELHDKGRRVHLQTHLSNFYLVGTIPYVMDWATARKLGKDAEENILNRTIDIIRPATDYETVFSSIFPDAPKQFRSMMNAEVKGLIMEVYSKNPKKEINVLSLAKRTSDILGKNPTDYEIIAQWMKDKGIERYSPEELERRSIKVGRNEPCPCGSGIKYKRCCGKY